MARYAQDDRISLADTDDGSSSIVSSATLRSIRKPVERCNDSMQRDSFSDLASLMKAKSYAPAKPCTPSQMYSTKPPLSLITNGTQSAQQDANSRSIFPSIVKPVHRPGTVAEFLDNHDDKSAFSDTTASPGPREQDQNLLHLQSLIEGIQEYPTDDNSADMRRLQPPSPLDENEPSLLPGFQMGAHFGSVEPPTPAESIQILLEPALTPKVHANMKIREDMTMELNYFKEQNEQLKKKVTTLEHYKVFGGDDETKKQLGLLRYQNEFNRTQKVNMGLTIKEKDLENKKNELEIADLKKRLFDLKSIQKNHDHTLAMKNRELEMQINSMRQVENMLQNMTLDHDAALKTLQILTVERDAATEALQNTIIQSNAYKNQAENLKDALVKSERISNDRKLRISEEQRKATELEDENDSLKYKASQVNIDDLNEKLHEKTSLCDRQRNLLKNAERNIALSEERIKRLSNNGEILRGGAHLVKPAHSTRLPSTIVSCAECYAKNIPCDNKTRCRNCVDNNTSCARWRCSMMHKLGYCADIPCKIPHDAQGWLILQEDRPQW